MDFFDNFINDTFDSPVESWGIFHGSEEFWYGYRGSGDSTAGYCCFPESIVAIYFPDNLNDPIGSPVDSEGMLSGPGESGYRYWGSGDSIPFNEFTESVRAIVVPDISMV